MDVEDHRIEEEYDDVDEEEESIDYEYDENEAIGLEEEEVEDLEEMTSPWVSSWIDYADDGKIVDGIMVIDDDIHNPKNKCRLDNCSICHQPWTCLGKHGICSLPCGHMYGLSCIKKWILQSSSGGKCPQCDTLCAYDDVILLYASASHLCVADHQKVSSTRRFPFTRQGATDFKNYLELRNLDAVKLWNDEQEHLSNVLKHQYDAKNLSCKLEVRWDDMLTRAENLEERAKELNGSRDARRADALRLRADAFKRCAVELERRAAELARHADALERRLDALEQRVDASKSNLFFFLDMYIAHHKKHTEPCAFSFTTLMQQLYDGFFPSSGATISSLITN